MIRIKGWFIRLIALLLLGACSSKNDRPKEDYLAFYLEQKESYYSFAPSQINLRKVDYYTPRDSVSALLCSTIPSLSKECIENINEVDFGEGKKVYEVLFCADLASSLGGAACVIPLASGETLVLVSSDKVYYYGDSIILSRNVFRNKSYLYGVHLLDDQTNVFHLNSFSYIYEDCFEWSNEPQTVNFEDGVLRLSSRCELTFSCDSNHAEFYPTKMFKNLLEYKVDMENQYKVELKYGHWSSSSLRK
ncbi:hypothetical protein [Saprospira grandis]|uniref:Uncharacterized protein n=1 Tax=Saprospira grandis (strain Lewin) TaxID=984262 RepID=H6L5T2_SAPGL|nr:hypothetical protein [Saprospira grandis]AFC26332.1 hypothetical protein SGRA_3608 [Saprospira grandis str. Lewin]